jgi:hypothetical protein
LLLLFFFADDFGYGLDIDDLIEVSDRKSVV